MVGEFFLVFSLWRKLSEARVFTFCKKSYVLFSEKPYIAFLNQNLAGERSGLFLSPLPSILAQIRRDFFSEKKSLPALIIFNSKFNYF